MDGTLYKPKGKHVFAKFVGDWQLAFRNIEQKIKNAIDDNFTVVIFTNQLMYSKNTAIFRGNVEGLLRFLEVPIVVIESKNLINIILCLNQGYCFNGKRF